MTDTNDEDRRPPRGGRRAPHERPDGRPSGRPGNRPAKGDFKAGGRPSGGAAGREGGKSFLTRRPKGGPKPDFKREAPPRRTLPTEGEAAPSEAAPPAEMRIAKAIARAGLASRRDAEAMIEAGRVKVNGEAITSPALNVGPEDRIVVDGEPLPSRERTRLWLFHKPRGLVTTFRDPEGRPTVFDSLPEDMPRVVAIGRLDINTEGLLLLTNDGGLAKVIAHPETGWTRRYRARARGEVNQVELDKLRRGITIDGMEYGPVEATLDRVQGDNSWISLSLREGKNREVKRILEHLGLQVNRLIRLSFGPFQLGEIEQGLVEEIRTKVLKEQLGAALAAEAGADFESPVREPIAPFGRPTKAPARPPRPRRAGDERGGFAGKAPDFRRGGPPRDGAPDFRRGRGSRDDGPAERPRGREERPRDLAWRAEGDGPARAFRRERREDPKAERAASAERPRSRGKPIEAGEGRRVLVERLQPTGEKPRHRRDGSGRPDAGEVPVGRAPRGTGFQERRGPGGPSRGPAGRGGAPSRHKPDRPGGPDRGGKSFSGKPPRGGKPGGRGPRS